MTIISGSLPQVTQRYEAGFGSEVESISTSITADWSWYSKLQGIVAWNFKNNSIYQESVVLYRSGYFFGNAYFPIYLANGITTWAGKLSPLMNKGADRNTMPLGVVDFGKGKRIIAFVFTFDPGQKWSVLEGGFAIKTPPSNAVVYGLELEKAGSFCIGYDPRQVTDYDTQTSSSLGGYSPNPDLIKTVEVSVSSYAPHVQLFARDSVTGSPCTGQTETVIESNENVAPGDFEEIIANVVKKIRSF